MAHTHHPHFSLTRAFATAFLMTGVAVLFAAQGELCLDGISRCALNADVTTEYMHPAAELENTMRLQWQMILGMTMILGGFLCHLLYVRKHHVSSGRLMPGMK